MIRTLSTAAAARLANTTTAAVRGWCRRGTVAAVKTARGWAVELASLLRRLNGTLPRPADRPRRGERKPVLTGRAGRRYEARHAARATATARRHRVERPRRGARPATHVLYALAAAHNAGWHTAADYLRGIGFPEAERYAAAFGRVAAQTYRTVHGTDPFDGCVAVVNGRLRDCFGYAGTAELRAASYSYARTAEFLADRRAAALHALAA